MNTINTIVYVAVICLSLQIAATKVEAKAFDSAKDAAIEIAAKSAENVAAGAEAQEAEKSGGIRQTILNTGVDVALDKGLNILSAKYPALKAAAPIAKNLAVPMINKAHEKFSNMMKRNKSTTTPASSGDSEAATTIAPEEAQTEEAAEHTAETDAETTPVVTESDGTSTESVAAEATEKPGLLGKIKSLVKGEEEKPAGKKGEEAKKE